MNVHLVFVTKYRKKLFSKTILESLKTIFHRVRKNFDSILVEFNGEKDHVHLLVRYPPKTSASKLVNHLKGVSSRSLRNLHPEIQKIYWKGALWSPSYFSSSCGGAPLDTLKKYIQNQNTPKSSPDILPLKEEVLRRL